ncbi:MAG: hypothetical protein JRH07_13320 [Deltaproteobacteria bacterium]|nr:hypothetical protein [Deltaproteobacteria bacterium]MBW2122805.1 hypothetical protein [Deltaproteobacteria bacterium]
MRIENAIVLLFLSKPLIDLSWNKPLLAIAGKNISFLHLTGAGIFVYFGLYILRLRGRAPLTRWMLLFLGLNLCSFLYAYLQGITSDVVRFADLVLRMADSFLIYHVTFLSRRIHQRGSYFRLFWAVFWGTAVAAAINAAMILMKLSGLHASQGVLRMSGLYHDPGVLSNLALYNLIFASILFQTRIRNEGLKLILAAMMCIDLYLIYSGLSRTVIVQLFFYGTIYLVFITRGVKRLGIFCFASLVGLGIVLSGVDFGRFEKRFQTELALIRARTGGDASYEEEYPLGLYEHLGTNRFKMWIFSLREIRGRDTFELFFGNFKSTPAHCDYIDVLSRNGVVGLAVYLYILLSLWGKSLHLFLRTRERSREDRIIHGLGFAFISLYILYGFPFRPLAYTTTAWYMWAGLGLSLGKEYWVERERSAGNEYG